MSDYAYSGILLADLIDAELCRGELGGEKAYLMLSMQIWEQMAFRSVVQALSDK